MHGPHFACQGFFLMGILAASSPWLLWVALLGTRVCTYLNHREFDLIDIWSRSNAEAKMLNLGLKVAFDLILDILSELAGTPPYTFSHPSWSLPCPELYCLAYLSVWSPQSYQGHTGSCLPNSGRFCTMATSVHLILLCWPAMPVPCRILASPNPVCLSACERI